jgi:myo-inositol-1(or 4)-monophosphatase
MGEFTAQSINQFVRMAQRWKKIRIIGSAALSLAYVACGRMDAYWERDIMLWDVSAGLALVRSAGGAFRMKQGNHPLSRHVLATNRKLLHKIDGVNGLT